MRLSLQLLLGLILIFTLAGWFVLNIFVGEIKPGIRSATEDTLVDMAQLLAPLALDDLQQGHMIDGKLAQAFNRLNQRPINAMIDGHLKQQAEYRIYVVNRNGIVVYDSEQRDLGKDYSRWNDVYLTLQGQYGARSSRSDTDDPNSTVMYVAAPLFNGNNIIGAITVAKPNRTLLPMIERSERQLLQAATVLLGIALLIGGLLTWWLNRSISKLVSYADAVSNNQSAQLPRLHSPELKRLGRSLETMRHQLDGKTYIEQYVHSLTHELKSPLAAIKGAGEILREMPPANIANRFITNINQETTRMQRLIERMLELAKLESGQELDRQPCDPIQLGKSAIDARQNIAKNRHITLKTQLTGASIQKWDRLLVEQALGNLLDNAIDFSPPNSTVTLIGDITPSGYRFQVKDQGPGIPDYALPRIFERFYSLPRPNRGKSSGLGLSFAMEVARQHGGLVTLKNSQDGGVLATLKLKK